MKTKKNKENKTKNKKNNYQSVRGGMFGCLGCGSKDSHLINKSEELEIVAMENDLTDQEYKELQKMVNDLYNENYEYIKFLGKGSFGIVCEFINENGEKYAIKSLHKKGLKTEYNTNYINSNVNKCNQYSQFILTNNLREINNKTYLFSEPLENNLFDFLVENENLKNEIKKYLICQLIYGIYCLHSIGIIHGDLKLENIFIKKNKEKNKYEIKFADFDGSGIIGPDNTLKHPVSIYTRELLPSKTRDYILVNTINNIKMPDDIFALGIMIVGIINFERFEGLIDANINDNEEIRFNVINEIIRETSEIFNEHKSQDMINEFINILSSILLVEDERRITIEQLANNDLIQHYCKEVSEYFFNESFPRLNLSQEEILISYPPDITKHKKKSKKKRRRS